MMSEKQSKYPQTFEEYQGKIREITHYPQGWAIGNVQEILHISVSLGGEAGEVLNEINQANSIHHDGLDNFNDMSEERRQNIIGEIGDLLWYITTLMTLLRISWPEVVRYNINKITKKQRNFERKHGSKTSERRNLS